MGDLTRRSALISGALALGAPVLLTRPGDAAEFPCKFGCVVNSIHPLTKSMTTAAARIRERTGGRVDIQVFHSSQLGSEVDMLTQLRSGGLEFLATSSSLLAAMVPSAAVSGVAFAFASSDEVWRSMDGALGAFVRSDVSKAGIMLFDKIWNAGFFEIMSGERVIERPEDLAGFRLRVPMGQNWIRMYNALGAAPVGLNFGEVYTALQTKVVDGLDAALTAMASAKIYEVQKNCTLTSHIWDGWWIAANPHAFSRIPEALREIIAEEFGTAALAERAELDRYTGESRATLTQAGIAFHDVDRDLFRRSLATTSYYRDWRAKLGERRWAMLEQSTGRHFEIL